MLKDKNGALSLTKLFGVIGTIVLLITGVAMADKLFETVDADEVKIFQDPIDGELHFHTDQGTKFQGFAKVTTYKKRGQIWFMPPEGSNIDLDSAEAKKYGYKTRFNDGGGAVLLGSISYNIPEGDNALREIRKMYPSQKSLETDLIKQVLSKSVYMTGPTMSSKESYADKRPLLIEYIEDQVQSGAYKTALKEVKVMLSREGERVDTHLIIEYLEKLQCTLHNERKS